METFYHYWGKAEQDTLSFHLLPYHCLDVTAVAAVWWNASATLRRAFRLHNDLPEERLRAWVLFFVALHDYGKFDVRFQLRVRPIWRSLYPDAALYSPLPAVVECRNYYHGEGGLSWFLQDNALPGCKTSSCDDWDQFDLSEGCSSRQVEEWKPWLERVTGHHGHIRSADYVAETSLSPLCHQGLAQVDRTARKAWLSALEALFLKPVGLSLSDSPPSCSPLLPGFCSVADWLGSRCDEHHFTYRKEPIGLKNYFEERYSYDAPALLKLAGMIAKPRPYAGVGSLLDGPNKRPRSLQTLVDELPLQPGLTLVEAPTGSGKTEAALGYAWRIVASGLADSVIFALPTQATANAMLGRLMQMAPLLFEYPNLLLAHSSARFNDTFTAIKHSSLDQYEREDGWVQCSQWLAESRKRIFLGQIGVCTIDQVLISVLPVKHRFVRSFGVGRSVLIVDEVHAYDAYMYGLLEEVLRQQKACGGTAILLSATLPEMQRQQLCGAWDAALEKQGVAAPYPLASWTAGGETTSFTLHPTQLPKETKVKVEPIRVPEMLPDEQLLSRVLAAAEAGAQVALICNLVNVAQETATKLRSMTDLPVDLFHARYCYAHRQQKEKRTIMRFGPKGKRRKGRILVATQVVEQSLDVDFDWLITQLCPIDLLFQRIGRLHRHSREVRPPGFEAPLCTVLLPDGEDFGLHGYIYANTRLLWRTAEKLVSAPDNTIVFPAAYRDWIELVYQESPWGNEPDEVEKGYEKFKFEIEDIKRFKARYMVNSAMSPFTDTDERITAVTRDGDMSLTVVPYCRTQRGKLLMDGTVFESLDEYKRLEALSLNSVGVPKSWRGFLGQSEDGRYWLEMEQENHGYRGCSKDVTFRYNKHTGLEKEK